MVKQELFLKLALGLIFSQILTGCQKLYYYPSRVEFTTPLKFSLPYEELKFKSADGTLLNAYWIKNTALTEKGTIVFFHGNAENISTHFLYMAWITRQGYNLFIFDYRAYGKSAGELDTRGTVEDGIAAIDFAFEHQNNDKPLIIYGHSLGGIIAMRSLEESKTPVKLLILDSTFSSYQKLAKNKLQSNWITFIFSPLAYLLISDEHAPNLTKQKYQSLIIHGKQDQVVPYEFGEKIYAQWPSLKCFWPIELGSHNQSIYHGDNNYREKLLNYLETPHGC